MGIEGLTLSASDVSVEVNQEHGDGTVADFSGTPLTVMTGPGSTLDLSTDGSLGELIRVSGHMSLDLFGFVQVEGDLAFEKRTTEITLDSGETLTVDLLALGANGLSAFVGMNGGTPDQIGLALTRAVTRGQIDWIEGSHLYPMERPQAAAEAVLARLALPAGPGAPGLLVLDEPFNALDVASVAQLTALLAQRLAQGAILVYTTHQGQSVPARHAQTWHLGAAEQAQAA